MQTAQLVRYLNEYLSIREIGDSENALNGLQVAGPPEVNSIAAAVDASEAAIRGAIQAGASMLLVHHGLFWDGNLPVRGPRYRRLKLLLDNDVAVYSAHVPLDVHPEVGNNPLLARKLGVQVRGRFAEYKGTQVGVYGDVEMPLQTLRDRVATIVDGPVRVIEGGRDPVRRVGIVTGAGASALEEAADMGLDTLITGEASHHHFFEATERRVSLLLAGHYATETLGVQALAEHLQERFHIPWTFLDLPTGL